MTKFLLIQHHTAMDAWSPAAVRRHFDYQRDLDAELSAAGELVEAQELGGHGRTVTGAGTAASVLPTLAGYRIVDVASEERALQIAAKASAAPGADGGPLGQPIDVRPLLTP
jgi:hypothetical protein